MISRLRARLATTPRQYAIYAVTCLSCGLGMNLFGKVTRVAEFAHRWQVATCYGLYFVPTSLIVRGLPWLEQYAYGVLFLAPLEMIGFRLGTSLAWDGNLV